MKFSFKKFLPAVMQDTRWGSLIEVVQDILMNDVKPDKIDILKTQFEIDSMTNQDIIYLAKMFGRDIPNYTGYTNTTFYFRRQILSLVLRYLYRNTQRAYIYTSYVYVLTSGIYPIYKDGTLLYVDNTWETNNEETSSLYYFDSSPLIYFDDVSFPYFDTYTSAATYTRHLIYSYSFNYIESVTDGFMSLKTCKALYKDIQQQKRKTEIIYYEPHVTVNFIENSTNTETYVNYPDMTSGTLSKIAIHSSGNLSGVCFVNISNSLTSELRSYSTTSGCLIEAQTSGSLIIRKQPAQKYKMMNYNTIALLDQSSGSLANATIPMVNFDPDMYCNWKFTFSLV